MARPGLHTFTLHANCILICITREESSHLCTPGGVWKMEYYINHKNRQQARYQKGKQFSFLSTRLFPIDCSGKIPSSHSQSLGQQQKYTHFLSILLQRLTNERAPAASLYWLTHHWCDTGIDLNFTHGSYRIKQAKSWKPKSHVHFAHVKNNCRSFVKGDLQSKQFTVLLPSDTTNMNPSATLPSFPWQK